MYNLQNFHIFQTENPRSLKYGVDVIPYRASQFWQQLPIDVREAASLVIFKNCMKTWKCKDCPCRLQNICKNIYTKCRVYLIRVH